MIVLVTLSMFVGLVQKSGYKILHFWRLGNFQNYENIQGKMICLSTGKLELRSGNLKINEQTKRRKKSQIKKALTIF